MKGISELEFSELAKEFGLTEAKIKTVDSVESGGKGFDDVTSKIIIQFEPTWFKRKSPYTPSGKWSLNKVEVQSKEWLSFNDAFSKNQDAAMESTSIGRMQVMGFHWKGLGFKSVGAMWDFAKKSEANQLRLGLMFIATNKKMFAALKNGDWNTFAYYYNGEKYKDFKYDTKLKTAYDKFSK